MDKRSVVSDAVAQAYADQPGWLRRKGTLLQILQALGWVLGVLGSVAADWPEWAVLVIGGLSYLVAAGITALTQDGFTPSMVERAADAVPLPPQFSYDALRDAVAVGSRDAD